MKRIFLPLICDIFYILSSFFFHSQRVLWTSSAEYMRMRKWWQQKKKRKKQWRKWREEKGVKNPNYISTDELRVITIFIRWKFFITTWPHTVSSKYSECMCVCVCLQTRLPRAIYLFTQRIVECLWEQTSYWMVQP